jgi:(R,R)-butanediol dehydrogenase / meso-butanediol dehydrogenase / diacetyl reductase
MKAAILEKLGKISIIEKPRPEIGSEEVLVKVDYCGICGSDIHGYLDGSIIGVGTIMGHECSGIVAEAGNHLTGFQPGDRVVVKPYFECGNCYWCKNGQAELCAHLVENFIGNSPKADGAFAEFLKISHPQKMLFKLPPAVSLQDAALIEPLATSFHSIRISGFKPGDRVMIIGAGPIGLGILQMLKLGGAGKIIVLQRSPERAEVAKAMGADLVLNPESEGEGLMDKVYSLTNGMGPDIVFEAAGMPSAFQNAVTMVRSGGQVIVVGLYSHDVSFNPSLLVIKGAELRGAVAYDDYDFERVIEFFNQKRIPIEHFISDIISLDDIEEKGFKRLVSGSKGIKVLVKP